MKWISVKDRLPELDEVWDPHSEQVLCALDVNIFTGKREIGIGYYDYEIKSWHCLYRIGDITHWTPFPKPPKQ